jgi:hypothetical protein
VGKEKYSDARKDESHETSTLTEKVFLAEATYSSCCSKWQGIGKYFLLSLIGGLGTLFQKIMQEKFDASGKMYTVKLDKAT